VNTKDDLIISGDNSTISVPNGVTVGGFIAIFVPSTNVTLNNAGVVGGFYGVYSVNAAITSLNNTGTISSSSEVINNA
jgi:hypothetical protein